MPRSSNGVRAAAHAGGQVVLRRGSRGRARGAGALERRAAPGVGPVVLAFALPYLAMLVLFASTFDSPTIDLPLPRSRGSLERGDGGGGPTFSRWASYQARLPAGAFDPPLWSVSSLTLRMDMGFAGTQSIAPDFSLFCGDEIHETPYLSAPWVFPRVWQASALGPVVEVWRVGAQ